MPVEHRAAPAADIAAEPAIEVALIETHAPAEADDLIAQTADNSDVPPPAAASEPAAVDDLEFLLEPLSSQVAPGPDVVAPEPEIVTSVPKEAIPAPDVAASAPEPVAAAEPAAPTRGLAALLPEPDEDPADLFEIMPEPSEVDAAIPPPSLDDRAGRECIERSQRRRCDRREYGRNFRSGIRNAAGGVDHGDGSGRDPTGRCCRRCACRASRRRVSRRGKSRLRA